MTDEQDEIVALRASYDQLSERTKPLAEATASYYKQLRRKGVPTEEAMELARDYQARLFDGAGLE